MEYGSDVVCSLREDRDSGFDESLIKIHSESIFFLMELES